MTFLWCFLRGIRQEAQPSGANPSCLSVSVPSHAVARQGGEVLSGPDKAALYGQLKDSESLQNMDNLFRHLDVSKRNQVADLIKHFPCLFGDTPTCTHLIEHDINVGFIMFIQRSASILMSKFKYMLDNGIAEPCLLVPKADNTPKFCSEFCKINNIRQPDYFPLMRMEGCIDQVGSAKFVSKFDLTAVSLTAERLLAGSVV